MSWYEPIPETSLDIISALKVPKDAAIIDIGGGDSLLVDHLLDLGYHNITVLDISEVAIERAKKRLQEKAGIVKWVVSDMLLFKGTEDFDVWHDRAAFHFLTEPQDQELYLAIVNKSLKEKAYLVLSTFALNGPEKCSNLPVRRYAEITLITFFSRYFRNLHCFTKAHATPLSILFSNFCTVFFKKINNFWLLIIAIYDKN